MTITKDTQLLNGNAAMLSDTWLEFVLLLEFSTVCRGLNYQKPHVLTLLCLYFFSSMNQDLIR